MPQGQSLIQAPEERNTYSGGLNEIKIHDSEVPEYELWLLLSK